ncbi:MAG: glycosyltransferase family 4 protein [Moorea sp. SIO1G6]|uniref:glycosyltransferase family 4 protein n=1 Tax=Moorena sp. SIO1G6 TaxID=2607840 RepID=UPI0013C294EF|nr:glycosyltransferase family 4 protein [Moorena sp. SIO1G6]NET62919.1 glycosyltransferase family 4 protein [Moorena sp. SIO1G6]
MTKKLILTIFYQFNPWHSSIGGIQTFIRSFIKYAPSEFEVRLVGTGDLASASGVWQEGEVAGRAIQFMPLFPLEDDNVRGLIPTTVKYTTALFGRCFASDFMHFHRIEPSLAALNWSGEKTLFVHNDIAKQMNPATSNNGILWQRFSASYFAMERLLVKQFSQIFSCNTESAKFYQQRYPAIANRIAYLKNTVDDEVFYPLDPKQREQGRKALAQEHNLSEQTRFILFAGRLHPQKDPMLLIRAMASLYIANVHLLIAGDGELKDELRAEICFFGLSKRVTMLGAVGQEKLANLYRVCSVFVLTSVYEGLPLTVLEALACGTPVVTTNCGETPNFLRADSGIVCTELTKVAIADALGKVLHHPENYPVSSCVRTAQPYSARKVVSSVYEQMLQRAHQRSA